MKSEVFKYAAVLCSAETPTVLAPSCCCVAIRRALSDLELPCLNELWDSKPFGPYQKLLHDFFQPEFQNDPRAFWWPREETEPRVYALLLCAEIVKDMNHPLRHEK